MTHTYTDHPFRGLRCLDEPVVIGDLELVRCTFRDCNLWTLGDHNRRARVHHVKAVDCDIFGEGSKIRGVVVEDCLVDGLKADGLAHFDACVYKHVVLRGRIGKLLLTNAPLSVPSSTAAEFVEANAAYYKSVDWALDIREATFEEQLGIRGIPSRLVRRDPTRHVVVTLEQARIALTSQMDLHRRVKIWLETLVMFGWPDGVFVVPDRPRTRLEMLNCLTRLRELGMAQPD